MATAPRPRTSTREPAELGRRLASWLGRHLPGAEVTHASVPASNGMSSETLLFDIEHPDAPVRGCALRLAADPAAYTVFPSYDMPRQHRVMSLVAAHTDLPVPRVLWLEEDPAPLGAPFFVMARAEGRVPPDVMPYTYEGTGCTPPPTPNAPRSRTPASACWPGSTTSSPPRRRSSCSRPARAARCAATSTPSAPTTPGSCPDCPVHPCWNAPSTGWRNSGRPTRANPS